MLSKEELEKARQALYIASAAFRIDGKQESAEEFAELGKKLAQESAKQDSITAYQVTVILSNGYTNSWRIEEGTMGEALETANDYISQFGYDGLSASITVTRWVGD